MQLIVHGGAGSAPDEPASRQAVLDEAAATGAEEPTPTAAVVAAIGVLERAPRFNAGVGGAIQDDGVVRTDAGIMTDEREVGAACSMPGVRDAGTVARVVMEETPHVLVAGEHAVSLAEGFGIETDVDLTTERTRERWADLSPPGEGDTEERLAWVREQFGVPSSGARRESEREGTECSGRGDTVGAVAVEDGKIAAATSTGGRWCALAGRVGDVPQVGSGFYATPAGGASATGAGEDIARVTLSRLAVERLEAGDDPEAAAEHAIDELADVTGSEAGIIVLDETGRAGSAYNTEAMQTSTARK
ncbi:isoaspartyl peptidase/L-asparaginase [Halococcus agarilyticus]|uniref:isoaspartyl peptidase/L-asparaginase n=1 Tax=Halococcus agarilyticus TaxID=1232219 RepID=UPI000677C765|nr:isoaspartyl peptidase/L-asparaginase [Halococcus agarilyticus]